MPADDPVAEWLVIVRRDLVSARLLLDHEQVENAAFFAQQAAEKALKALLAEAEIRPPKIHDLETLFALLPAGVDHPLAQPLLETVTAWAVAARYLDQDIDFPSLEEVRVVIDSVEAFLQRRGDA